MFRARKPSLKRPPTEDTPRKRARVGSSAGKASPLLPPTPIAKPLAIAKGRKSASKASAKGKQKKQTRIRFPKSPKSDKAVALDAPDASPSVESKAVPEAVKPINKAIVPNPVDEAVVSETAAKVVSAPGPVVKPVELTSRKKLNFGGDQEEESVSDDVEQDVSEVMDSQQDVASQSQFWPPYEADNELLCRPHQHRLIKPEDDPILDAALELLL